MKEPLKPCPFCGGEASFGKTTYGAQTVREQKLKQDTFHFVNCIVCGGNNQLFSGYETQERAAEWWNRRTEPGPSAEIESLRADLARVSEELGLPPTIGPAPGWLKETIARAKSERVAFIAVLRMFVEAEEAWAREKSGMPDGFFDDPLGEAYRAAKALLPHDGHRYRVTVREVRDCTRCHHEAEASQPGKPDEFSCQVLDCCCIHKHGRCVVAA